MGNVKLKKILRLTRGFTLSAVSAIWPINNNGVLRFPHVEPNLKQTKAWLFFEKGENYSMFPLFSSKDACSRKDT
jgi:hypothetical protein